MPVDIPAYHAAVAGYDWGRALTPARTLADEVTGHDRIDKLRELSNIERHLGDWDAARASMQAAWHHAQSQGLAMHGGQVMHFAAAADVLGLNDLTAAALTHLPAHVETPWNTAIMQRRVDAAQATRIRLRGKQVRILPLGQECLPFNILMKWGFFEFGVDGPFTAGVFPRDCVQLALEDKFAAFLDPEAYRTMRTPQGLDAPLIQRYGCLLNHECGPYYCADGLAETVRLYTTRTQAAQAALTGTAQILFMIERTRFTDLPALLETLFRLYADRHPRVFVLDDGNSEPDETPIDDPRVTILPAPRPSEAYVWHRQDHYSTEEGYAYESPMAAALEKLVAELG